MDLLKPTRDNPYRQTLFFILIRFHETETTSCNGALYSAHLYYCRRRSLVRLDHTQLDKRAVSCIKYLYFTFTSYFCRYCLFHSQTQRSLNLLRHCRNDLFVDHMRTGLTQRSRSFVARRSIGRSRRRTRRSQLAGYDHCYRLVDHSTEKENSNV